LPRERGEAGEGRRRRLTTERDGDCKDEKFQRERERERGVALEGK